MNKREVIDKLRDIIGRLQIVQKEISTTPVDGLLLTREDLEPKRSKKKKGHEK